MRVADGRLVWCADGQPVTLPAPAPVTPTMTPTPTQAEAEAEATPRARAIAALVEPRLVVTRRREALLREAREAVADAEARGAPATPAALAQLTAPLVAEGLLRGLRDPHFHERARPMPSVQSVHGYQVMWEMYKVRSRWRADGGLIDPKAAGPAYALPSTLLDGLSWEDVLAALDHEEGRGVNGGERVATADERLRPKPGKLGGIFVIDQFGSMHAGQKVPGVFQHSSMTGGHCCRFAGSITVQDGRVLALTPHSGHYVPTQAEYDNLVADWRRDGLDLSEAEIGGFVKDKKRARQAAAAVMEGGER